MSVKSLIVAGMISGLCAAAPARAKDPVAVDLHGIEVAARSLKSVASSPHPSTDKVWDAASVVVGRIAQLSADIDQYPSAASHHSNAMKRVEQTAIRLGSLLIELPGRTSAGTFSAIADSADEL